MRNTRATYRKVGDSPPKGGLIPNVAESRMTLLLKLVMALYEGLMAYQLVGGVTAHQGKDG